MDHVSRADACFQLIMKRFLFACVSRMAGHGPESNEKLFIHATNVHQGGGRTLLGAILKLSPKLGTTALLDERMPLPIDMDPAIEVIRAKPSILGRLNIERLLASEAARTDTILCFGNLPPLFKLAGRVKVFVQNRYLIDDVSLSQFSVGSRTRLTAERIWFRLRARLVDEFIVQTPSMKVALEQYLARIKTKPGHLLKIIPFMGADDPYADVPPASVQDNRNGTDFVYVGSGEPHKNHRRLVDAWILLAQAGHYPSLSLTVDAATFPDLCRWIEDQASAHQLRIVNRGAFPHGRMKELYRSASALIYPSTFESFGLPLIEARHAGLAVLAGELDYVRDVVEPEQTFDANSAISIARAVKRFKRLDEPTLAIVDARTFVDSLTRPISETATLARTYRSND